MKSFFRIGLAIMLLTGTIPVSSQNLEGNKLDYKIITGQFEKGTREQKEAFIQLFGAEDTQAKFDLYFHWYNIAHEYGHCLLAYHDKGMGKVQEELLVNRFAVSYWKTAGLTKELADLKILLEEILNSFPNPVPEGRSLVEWYTEIWGSDLLVSVPVYGYLQFKGVLMALEESESLMDWLDSVGIECSAKGFWLKEVRYPVNAESASLYLEDIQNNLRSLGIKIPSARVELIDDPTTHCAQKVNWHVDLQQR